MLTPLTGTSEIAGAVESLGKRLSRDAHPFVRSVGWRGGRGDFTVHWRAYERFWWFVEPRRALKRYWFCFGTEDPTEAQRLSITCEINPPLAGATRRVAGIIARAEDGGICLAHTGKIGGGRKGIGRDAFLDYCHLEAEPVRWPDGQETEALLIGALDSPRLPAQIAHFVREVQQFKSQIGTPRPYREGPPPEFVPEFSGVRAAYRVTGSIESRCDHGLVVSALAEQLRTHGYTVANDRQRDLFALRDDAIRFLFEVKTELTTTCLYEGVGQLMLHGTSGAPPPQRVLVMPEGLNAATINTLRGLSVAVLSYRWRGNSPSFERLRRILTR